MISTPILSLNFAVGIILNIMRAIASSSFFLRTSIKETSKKQIEKHIDRLNQPRLIAA